MARTFIVVDDHPLFRAALAQVLSDAAEIRQANDLDELIGLLETETEVDLVLLDLHLPGAHGFSGLLLIRGQFPHVPVLVVSATADPLAAKRSLELGASGFFDKSAPVADMRLAVETILTGRTWSGRGPSAPATPAAPAESWRRLRSLTPQQVRVLMLLSAGKMNKQIGHELGISEGTVKAHVSAILQKLGVATRTGALLVARALDRGQMDDLSDSPSS